MKNINLWEILLMFLATIGTISLIGVLLQNTLIQGAFRQQVSGFEYSSPIFAFIGAIVAMFIFTKTVGRNLTADSAMTIFIAGLLVLLLYVVMPQYLPPAFSILKW